MTPPKIEFPCDYRIRVLGVAGEDLVANVLEIVAIHAKPVPEHAVSVRDSRNGNYQSVVFSIWATGEPQLRALHADLVARSFVKLVL
jgi:hypothetical protein